MFGRFGQDRQLLILPVKIPNFLGRTAHCLVNTTADYAIRPLLIAPISVNMLTNMTNTSEGDIVLDILLYARVMHLHLHSCLFTQS